MVDELKPCPFCGGKAAASSCGACGFDLYIFVKCETCGARTMRFQAEDTDHFWDQPAAQKASEFWNRLVVAQNIRVVKLLDNYNDLPFEERKRICKYLSRMQILTIRESTCPLIEVPEWIPVTERLPDMHVEVLVCTEDYGETELGFATVAVFDGSGWLETWERKTYLTAVTYWMQLPKPPKEE